MGRAGKPDHPVAGAPGSVPGVERSSRFNCNSAIVREMPRSMMFGTIVLLMAAALTRLSAASLEKVWQVDLNAVTKERGFYRDQPVLAIRFSPSGRSIAIGV